MRVEVESSLRYWAKCPSCAEGRFELTHLVNARALRASNSFGPWYCRGCGQGVAGEISPSGDAVELKVLEERVEEFYDLLKLEPQAKPVYFVVRASRALNSKCDLRYLYEEHSCPTNHIHCELIVHDGDSDPHGLFKYVTSVTLPQDHKADSDRFSNMDLEDIQILLGEELA